MDECKAIKWATTHREKFYNQAQTSQFCRNDAHPAYSYSSPSKSGDVGGWLASVASAASASAALVDGVAPAHSTAHASDIISHVTLIFESSRYVDCIRSASAPALQYSFLPSFLPSFSSRASNYHPLPSPPYLHRLPPHLRLSIQTTISVRALDIFTSDSRRLDCRLIVIVYQFSSRAH